ncbi:hypothetical protein TeGR_g11307 [Tetraparma gracilis]|uniref:Phosphoglucomutase n=1 Tax=Tetraparma gracilis TaxID=2962635 RepID=A0ABQ6MDS3_9STRA|nr:hypothetical protein TeGR_g11307 [Tetraparma gracilis]
MRAALHPVFRHARGPISPLLSVPLSFPLSSLASSPPPSTFLERAEQYVAWDPNPSTRSYVSDLLNHHPTTPPSAPAACAFSSERLADLFSARLAFGTAGLRAPFGPGYSQMNDLTVIQTAQGLLSYLLSTMPLPELQSRGLVVGFDHRSSSSFTPFDLSSRNFANLTAAVFAERAVPCYLFPDFVATPLVPFAVAHHGAAAGVMVTASHNPKQDTGYKVYWGNGAQIIPPHDAGIASHITQNLEPWSASFSSSPPPPSPLLLPTEHLAPLYFEQMRSKLCRRPSSNSSSDSRITYTAMHGVGHDFSRRSFEAFSLPPYIPTLSQQAPDPGFPTVAFPNPEEGEGALAEAILAAESAGSRVIVANDPDADRLAVAERQAGGEWRLFTGNEIGAVLGHWQYSRASGSEPIAMLASTVSSKFLRAVAEKHDFLFEETLTGFKWMGNRSAALRSEGYDVVFAYEEAIGYCVGDLVLDKDGVCAAAVMGEIVGFLRESETTLAEHLAKLYDTYGYFANRNSYVKIHDKGALDSIFSKLRSPAYPSTLAGFKIKSVRDLTTGFDSAQPDNKATLPSDPSSHFLTLTMESGAVVSLRTSGTEPKLKYYIEAKSGSEQEGRELCDALWVGVMDELIGIGDEAIKSKVEIPP